MHHGALTWSRAALRGVPIGAPPKPRWVTAVSWPCPLGQSQEERIECLQLQFLHQPGENSVMAAVPARREVVVLGYAMSVARRE